MPWASVRDLPAAVQKKYRGSALRACLHAANAVLKSTKDEGRAMAACHTAAKGAGGGGKTPAAKATKQTKKG